MFIEYLYYYNSGLYMTKVFNIPSGETWNTLEVFSWGDAVSDLIDGNTEGTVMVSLVGDTIYDISGVTTNKLYLQMLMSIPGGGATSGCQFGSKKSVTL